MRRVVLIACGLALAGCAGCAGPGGPASATGPSPVSVSPPGIPAISRLKPSPFLEVGRVLAVDPAAHTVIVDVSPYAVLPGNLTGRMLLARNPGDLRPTGRLQASPYLRGLTLGTRLIEGQPVVGDEVVLVPPAGP